MNTDIPKYDPEDLESLMAHKTFDALYPEEKEFVLKHMESPEEYDSMRAMLLQLQENGPKDHITPDPALKEDLMALFATEKKRGFLVWLNGSFASLFVAQRPWYRQPAFAYAMAAAVLVFGGWFMLQGEQDVEVVAHQEVTEEVPASDNELDKTDESSAALEDAATNGNDDMSPGAVSKEFTPPQPEVTVSDAELPDVELVAVEEPSPSEAALRADDYELMEEEAEIALDDEAVAESFDADFEDMPAEDDAIIARDMNIGLAESTADPKDRNEVFRESDTRRKEAEEAVLAQDELAKSLAADSQIKYTLPPTLLDSGVNFTSNGTIDNYAGNVQMTPAYTESLSNVTIQSTDINTVESAGADLATRGLGFTYDASASESVPVKDYNELLDLLYTAW